MTEYRGTFPSTYASVSQARRAVVQYASCRGMSGESLDDVESAVGEALANAAEHGHADFGSIVVAASVIDGLLVVDIKDSGHGFAPAARTLENRTLGNSPRGFGIFIMRELMDVVEYSEHGSRLRLKKRIAALGVDASVEA